jgi:hypothetical protein
MLDEMARLRKQNSLMRSMLADMAGIMREIFATLPDNWQNVDRARQTVDGVIKMLDELAASDEAAMERDEEGTPI